MAQISAAEVLMGSMRDEVMQLRNAAVSSISLAAEDNHTHKHLEAACVALDRMREIHMLMRACARGAGLEDV